jgi:putative hemolysin
MLTQDQIEDWESSEEYYNIGEYPSGKTPLSMVKEFAKVTGQEPTPSLYVKLIGEELDEWAKEGMVRSEQDLKELADIVYVLYGYANAMGYNLDKAVRRVHENNVGRCVQPDGTVKRREDGKIVKNKDFPKVDLSDLL